MDSRTLALLIPILALSIPVLAIVFNGLAKVAQYRAMGAGADTDGALGARVEVLEHELHGLRQELAETQERLDFTERLLAKSADATPRVIRMPERPDPDPAA